MGWEWVVLGVFTVAGPLLFQGFFPVQAQVTVRGGAVFFLRYGRATQLLRCALKFVMFWGVALMLATLESRMWLRLWISVPVALAMTYHFIMVRRHRVHWLTGRGLA